MPRYTFECSNPACGVMQSQPFPMGGAPPSVDCGACGTVAARVFTSPQLNTRPRHLEDENKFGLGFSESDRRDQEKRDDASYKRFWDRPLQQLV